MATERFCKASAAASVLGSASAAAGASSAGAVMCNRQTVPAIDQSKTKHEQQHFVRGRGGEHNTGSDDSVVE